MAERKKFSVTSLSELFVLLAFVFLVQSIVNVALEEDAVAVQRTPVTQLVFNQFPSGGDTSDHLRYVSVGKVALVFLDANGCKNTFLGGKPESKLDATQCLNLPETPATLLSAAHDDDSSIGIFAREVSREYGVEVTILRGLDRLTKVSMVFDPKRVRDHLPIHVGMCVCNLSVGQEAVPASWNIQQNKFRTPHPMVVQTITYKGGVRRETALFYSHESDFRRSADGRPWPIAEATQRYAFNRPDCAPQGIDPRDSYIRDVELIWPELSKGDQGEI